MTYGGKVMFHMHIINVIMKATKKKQNMCVHMLFSMVSYLRCLTLLSTMFQLYHSGKFL
jgi:hypothetical protein